MRYILLFLPLFLITVSPIAKAQCLVTTTPFNDCTYGDAINSFTLNSIATTGNNGCANANGYILYTTPVRSLTTGQSYAFSATVGVSPFPQGFAIWIDLNANGQFESTEQVYASTTTGYTFSGNINIPTTATAGNNLRMRTMCAYNATIASTDACTGGLGLGYGETEDYYVNLVQGCPVAITTQPKDSTICAGNNALFSIVATNTNTYQWQVSTNGGANWSNITNGGVYSGAGTNTLSLTGAVFAMHNYQYRCVATNTTSSCSVNSAAGILKVNDIPAIVTTTPGAACTGSPAQVGATATTGATIQWYNQATGGTLLGTGNTLNIGSAPASNTNYYAFPNAPSVTVPNNSLSVQLAATNSQAGCFMDIRPLANIKMTDISWVPAATQSYDISIYFKAGTSVGSETTSGAWTLIGSQTGISATINVPHKITLSSPQNLVANSTYAILVIRTGSSGSVRYQTVSTLGGVEAQNSDVQLITAKGISGLFTGSLFSPRHLACIFWYEKTTSSPCSATVRTAVPLVVNGAPVVTVHPTPVTVCQNDNTSFAITATGTGTYQWEVSTNGGTSWSNVNNGGVYSGATTATLNINSVTPGMSTYQYRCRVACIASTTSNAATLTVSPAPTIITQPVDAATCEGGTTSFTCSGTGAGTLSYKWEVSTNGGVNWNDVINGAVYSNANTATLDVTLAALGLNNNQYRCVVSGLCAPPATTNAVTLTINTAPVVTTHPVDVSNCPGTNISFTCAVTGTAPTYQWQEYITSWNNLSNGGGYSGVTTNTLALSGINAGQDGRVYRCVIGGTCTPADTTDTASLEVYPVPNITGTSNSPVCEGDALQLNSTSTTTGITYSWTGPGGYSSATQNPSIVSPVLANSGDYIVTTTITATGCTMKDTVPVVIKITPSKPVLTSNSAVCTQYDIELTASSTTGATYSWTGPTGFTSIVQNPKRPNAIVQMAGYYKVVATINGCPSDADSIYVNVVQRPSVGAYPSPGNVVCTGDTIRFFGISANTGNGPAYQWMKNGTPIQGADSLKYTGVGLNTGDVIYLRMTPGAGPTCTADVKSFDMPITVLPILAPSVAISADPATPVWQGLLVTFTATPVNAGTNPKYQWKRNGQAEQGATGQAWAATTLDDKDVITCEITSDYKCPEYMTSESNPVTVTVRTGVSNTYVNNDIALYPNPNKGSFTLKGKVTGSKVHVEILNAVGQVVYKNDIVTLGGDLQQEIQAGNMVDGIYMLRIQDDGGQKSIRFRVAN